MPDLYQGNELWGFSLVEAVDPLMVGRLAGPAELVMSAQKASPEEAAQMARAG